MGIKTIKIIFLLLAVSCVNPFMASAKDDTLSNKRGEKVVITYNVRYKGSNAKISFVHCEFLSATHNRNINNTVIFFDRNTSNKKISVTNNVKISKFYYPNGTYSQTTESFFNIKDRPVLYFDMSHNPDFAVSIPMFAACENKKKFEVFDQFSSLTVHLRKPNKIASTDVTGGETKITTPINDMEDLKDNDATAETLIEYIENLLGEQESLPFDSDLEDYYHKLIDVRPDVRNPKLSNRIDQTISLYKNKEKELKASAMAEQQRLEQQAKEEAAVAEEKAKKEQAEEAEKQHKRTLWMIIGGVLLGVLGIVFNQLMQHWRNKKNQLAVMQMQQSVMQQAEEEVKRQTRNTVKRKTDSVIRAAENKGKQMVKKNKNSALQNKKYKDISI